MPDQERTPFDVDLEKVAFCVWLSGRSETNFSEARRNMMIAVREELKAILSAVRWSRRGWCQR